MSGSSIAFEMAPSNWGTTILGPGNSFGPRGTPYNNDIKTDAATRPTPFEK